MTNPQPHYSADLFWITAFTLRDLERMMSFVFHHVSNHWQAL